MDLLDSPTTPSMGSTETEKKTLTPEEVIDHIGTSPRLLFAVLLSALGWAAGSPCVAVASFATLDCQRDACNFSTIHDDFALRSTHPSNIDRDVQVEWFSSVFFLGSVLSAPLPAICDWLGRRPVFLFVLVATAVCGFAPLFSHSYPLILAARGMQGFFYTGILLDSWFIAYELCPMRWRDYVGLLTGALWAIGACVNALGPTLFSDWKQQLAFVSSFPLLLFVPSIFLVPETLHFLRAKQSSRQIEAWFTRMSGGGSFSDHFDMSLLLGSKGRREGCECAPLLRSRFCLYLPLAIYLWFVATFIYFGLTLISTKLVGDFTTNFVVMNLVELPGYLLAALLLRWIGRRWSVLATNISCGTCFFLISLVPDSSLVLGCWFACKFAITANLILLFVVCTECFPTNIRGLTSGICVTMSRLGACFAPYFKLMYDWNAVTATSTLAGACLVGAVLALLLPETSNQPLPDNMDDLNHKDLKKDSSGEPLLLLTNTP